VVLITLAVVGARNTINLYLNVDAQGLAMTNKTMLSESFKTALHLSKIIPVTATKTQAKKDAVHKLMQQCKKFLAENS
jgi:hypothetical protein